MYKIIGNDGKIYGPVTVEQIQRWIVERRVESRTPVFVEGAADWTFLGLRPEFAASFGGPLPVIAPINLNSPTTGQSPKTNSCATTGFIFGLLSWVCCCGFPFSLTGLILSLVALSQINASPQTQSGRTLAIAGLILSAVNLAVGFGWLLFSFAAQPPAAHIRFNHF